MEKGSVVYVVAGSHGVIGGCCARLGSFYPGLQSFLERDLSMDDKKSKGISSITEVEGLPEAAKSLVITDAIDLILRGRDPDEVKRVVQSIADGFAQLKVMSWQMDNRDALARYKEHHPDPC